MCIRDRKWSEHVKPIAKTDSCQAAHTGYFISGRMKVVMDDGEQMEYGPGAVSYTHLMTLWSTYRC